MGKLNTGTIQNCVLFAVTPYMNRFRFATRFAERIVRGLELKSQFRFGVKKKYYTATLALAEILPSRLLSQLKKLNMQNLR